MRSKTLLYAIAILTLLFMLILILALRDGNDCLSNPLTYGAEKMSSELTGDFSCSCGFTNPEYERVYFDKDNITTLREYVG